MRTQEKISKRNTPTGEPMKIKTPMTYEMGQHIRLTRLDKGLTQSKLAFYADTTSSQVSLIESGTPQSTPALDRVCKYLGLVFEVGQ